jgi:pimeloyl-ACP methyl ester carboxylesterase
MLRVDEQLPVKLQMGSLQQPLQPGTVLRFGSLEFMSLNGSYDMILLPPPCDSGNGDRQLARRRRNRRRLPRVVEEQHSSSPRPLPRRRRRRRGNQGQAGGSASSAVERVDGASAPTGGTSSIDLAFETKTSAVSPQHADSEQTDDASALAKGLLDVTLVPETMVRSVPDVTSSPPIDQEVPTDSHLTPFRFSLEPPSDLALADALVEASPNPLGYPVRSPWDRLTDVSTYGPSGSEEDDAPDFCWDFSGLGNPSAMRDFMTACDYCLFDCSDGSRSLDDEDCGPSRECFHVDLGGPSEGNHLGMPEDGDLPRLVPRVDIPRELVVVPVPAGGHDPQLEQIREVQARLDEGAGALEPIRRDVGQEWAGQPPAGEIRNLP